MYISFWSNAYAEVCQRASALELKSLLRHVQLAASLVEDACNSLGQDIVGALSDATSPCAKPIILRAGFLTFGGDSPNLGVSLHNSPAPGLLWPRLTGPLHRKLSKWSICIHALLRTVTSSLPAAQGTNVLHACVGLPVMLARPGLDGSFLKTQVR